MKLKAAAQLRPTKDKSVFAWISGQPLGWLPVVPLVLFALGGCGGGGSGSGAAPASASPSLPGPTALASSQGDLSRYVGEWVGECGKPARVTPATEVVLSVRNSYAFTRVNATTVTGTVRQSQFSQEFCGSETVSSQISKIREDFILTYIGSATVPKPASSFDNFSGSVDQISYLVIGAASNSTQPKLVAFSDNFTKLRIENAIPNSTLYLTYSK